MPDSDDYLSGYDRGWENAEDFIESHPHGMPWVALPEDEPEPPSTEYERGEQAGWMEQMRKEGWPLIRAEVQEEHPRPE